MHDVMSVLHDAHRAVAKTLESLDGWNVQGARAGQYACDIAADEAAFAVLDQAGVGILSEESPVHALDRDVVVVVDPVDGTANAIRGIPYYAVSLCAVDDDGPLAALVVNLATGTQFEAVRGEGATCDGEALQVRPCDSLGTAIVALCGSPRPGAPWQHMRAFGASALELCDVARGMLDGYINTDSDLGPWDYLGGLLVCQEAGAVATERDERPLVVLDRDARRNPLVATSPSLLAEMGDYARNGLV